MNDGIRILLERMETHPEEFVVEEEGVPAKWDNLIRSYEAILDLEDIALFKQARGKLLQQQFTEKVLEELVDPKSGSSQRWGKIVTPLVGQTPMPSISNISVTPSLEQTLARLKEIQKEYEPKPHKTIFGKLFNYS
jgi:hypothetical protein